MKKLLTDYLADFNADYLASPADRRRTLFYLTLALGLILGAALIIWFFPDPVHQVRHLRPAT